VSDIPPVRRLLFQLGLLALVPGFASSQVTLVNVTSCPTVALPGSCTIPATGSGHLIVIGVQIGAGVSTGITFSSITDNVGNVYGEAGAARSIDSAAGSVADIWYARNSVAGATTLNITSSTSVAGGGVVVWEFSGLDPSSPLDQTAVLNSQGSTTTTAGASVSIASAAEVIISLAPVASNVTSIATGNTFTNDSTVKGNGWAHLVTTATGTYSAVWTQSPAGTYASSTASFKAAASGTSPSNACDLAAPYGTIDTSDVQAAINMTLGISPCTANIGGAGVCNAAVVQRVVNAALGGTCVTGYGVVAHYVTLNWTASVTPNVTYNIYRSTTSGVYPSTPLASVGAATAFTDYSVQAGVTYFYAVTSVSGSTESAYSSPAQATILTP